MSAPRPTRPCKRCGAPIWMAFTDGYRRVPLDAEPVADGEYSVEANGVGDFIVRPAGRTRGLIRIGAKRYRLHPKKCVRAARA